MFHTVVARRAALLGSLVGVLVLLVAAPWGSAQAATRHHHHHHELRHHHHRHHHAAVSPSARRVATALRIAEAQRGKPYVYGASGPRAFDCSGLTSYAYHHAGFGGMPRTASAQAHFAHHIKRSRLHRGDLIFFTGGGGVYHVGLYAGEVHGHRLVLHAPFPGQRVHVERLWTDHWFAGTLRRA